MIVTQSVAKSLGGIHVDAIEILRFALDDKNTHHPPKLTPKTKRETMETKSIWQKILHIAITILTAIATTLGTTSCMGL